LVEVPLELRFPLTALKLSRRIIKGMSGGVLLKAQ
jgi:hypothetical protein